MSNDTVKDRVPRGTPTGGQFATSARGEADTTLAALDPVPFEHIEVADGIVVVPAGAYVVGDPCYTIHDDHWDDFLAASDPDAFGPEATSGDCADVTAATVDGFPCVSIHTIHTVHGDGGYEDAEGREFDVDSGTIGLVPVAYAQKYGTLDNSSTHIVEFATDVSCTFDPNEGTVVLGDVVIRTDPDPEPIFCISCGRPSDSEDYCTWGCGHGEEEECEHDEVDEDGLCEDCGASA